MPIESETEEYFTYSPSGIPQGSISGLLFFSKTTNRIEKTYKIITLNFTFVKATGQRLGTIVNSLATLIVSIGMSVYYCWQLGLVTLIFTPFMLLAMFLQNRLMGRENTASMKSLEKSTKVSKTFIV